MKARPSDPLARMNSMFPCAKRTFYTVGSPRYTFHVFGMGDSPSPIVFMLEEIGLSADVLRLRSLSLYCGLLHVLFAFSTSDSAFVYG